MNERQRRGENCEKENIYNRYYGEFACLFEWMPTQKE